MLRDKKVGFLLKLDFIKIKLQFARIQESGILLLQQQQ